MYLYLQLILVQLGLLMESSLSMSIDPVYCTCVPFHHTRNPLCRVRAAVSTCDRREKEWKLTAIVRFPVITTWSAAFIQSLHFRNGSDSSLLHCPWLTAYLDSASPSSYQCLYHSRECSPSSIFTIHLASRIFFTRLSISQNNKSATKAPTPPPTRLIFISLSLHLCPTHSPFSVLTISLLCSLSLPLFMATQLSSLLLLPCLRLCEFLTSLTYGTSRKKKKLCQLHLWPSQKEVCKGMLHEKKKDLTSANYYSTWRKTFSIIAQIASQEIYLHDMNSYFKKHHARKKLQWILFGITPKTKHLWM